MLEDISHAISRDFGEQALDRALVTDIRQIYTMSALLSVCVS